MDSPLAALQRGSAEDPSSKGAASALDLEMLDLVEAKQAFEVDRGDGFKLSIGLSQEAFVVEFCKLLGAKKAKQLGYLFMKIDCNSDGEVSWDEFLSYVMLQDKSKSQPLEEDLEQSRFEQQEPAELSLGQYHRDAISHVMYIPKTQSYVTAGNDATVRVWSGGQLLKPLHVISTSDRTGTVVNDLVVLPDALGKLAVASADRVVSFYELNDLAGSQRWNLHGKMGLVDMPLCLESWTLPDGTMCLAAGDDSGAVVVFDAKRLLKLVHGDDVLPLKAGQEREVKLLSPAFTEPAKLATLALHSDWVSALSYVESMRGLVSASLDTTLKITVLDWPPAGHVSQRQEAAQGGRKIPRDASHTRAVLRCHHKGVMCVVTMAVSGRRMCASSGLEHQVFVCSLETGDVIKTLEGHRSSVVGLAADETTEMLVSLAADGELRTWDLATLNPVQIIAPARDDSDGRGLSEPPVSAVAFNPLHGVMVTGSRRPALWQQKKKAASQEELAATMLAPHGHTRPLVGVLYSPQFFLVVTGDEGGLICVWDVKTGAALFRFEHRQAKLTAMQFDVSGRRLLTGAADGVVRLWNYSSGELMHEMGAEAEAEAKGGGPKARAAGAAGGDDADAAREVTSVLHITNGNLFNYFCSVGWAREVVLCPDPSKVARKEGSAADKRVELAPKRLKGHEEDILCVAFCPPNLLATGSYDGVICVWILQSGGGQLKSRLVAPADEVAGRLLHSRSVEGLTFLDTHARKDMHDAVVLASCGADGCLRFWNTRMGARLHTVEGACPPADALMSLCVEATSTFLVTGDSGGRLKVWDLSLLSDALAVPGGTRSRAGDDSGAVRLLFSWRAHRHPIVRVEYLQGIEGVMTASTDCTARLWTLSGEQVGLFGQEKPWVLDNRSTWLDRSRCIAGSENEGKAAELSEEQVQALLPPSLKAVPAARGGAAKLGQKQHAREPGRMSADELRGVLHQLRLQRPRSSVETLDPLGGAARRDALSAAKGLEAVTKHAVRSSSVLGAHDAASRCAGLLHSATQATLPPIAAASPMRHRKVFSSSTTSKRWAPERSYPLTSPLMSSSASAPALRTGR